MTLVSFTVVDGVDKGKVFLNLPTPVTIGREEGNMVRLNDERVSRFHAKVQEDQGQVVITDLDSTNGTSVNSEPIQLRLLRPGDRVNVGRSTLLFGTQEEISAAGGVGREKAGMATVVGTFDIAALKKEAQAVPLERDSPRLPGFLSPAQAAQLSEVIDFLHRGLADATANIQVPQDGSDVRIPLAAWQRLQTVLAHLARYSRQVAEPESAADTAAP
jgi:pSer/pThr/pTyr-binding forkhead associated (FHA) protein